MGLMEARMANRMQTRQMYRTANRMERRRARMMGPEYTRAGAEPEPQVVYQQAPEAPAAPAYVEELRQLAELQQQGVITPEEFEAKRRQLLGL